MKTLLAVCMALLCLLHMQRTPSVMPTLCSVAPYAVDIDQPDGTRLTVVASGNAIIHHVETSDGYTVVRNESHIYEYAVLNRTGNLIPSGIKASNPNERSPEELTILEGIPQHTRIREEAGRELIDQFENSFRIPTDASVARFPSSGSRKTLVLLIQYPDMPMEHSASEFDDLMNESNYNGTGSFKDFFEKNSYGQLNIDTDIFGWYTAEHNYDYYGYQNGFQRSRTLMAEAIDAAEAQGVDFSQYDNDGDGVVDAVIGVHAGPGAEVGAQLQYIWSHRWTLGSLVRNYDGVTITDYIINPETRPWGMVGVGVFCHEFGHVLGLPDLYDTDNSSRGIGNWGVMGNGAWLSQEHVPSNMDAWCKESLNWLVPELITEGSYSLDASDGHAACYRINTADPNEYFLLENRQKIGNDSYLPGSGLAIWHINEERTSTYPASNNVNADESLKGVDLEEADGLHQLDVGPGNGDDGDLFPGSTGTTIFDAVSEPSSNLYDGSESAISVTNIYEDDGIVYFRLNDPATCGIINVIEGDRLECQNGFYDQEVIVHYEYPPATGQIVLNGQTFEISGSPQTIFLSGLPADGQYHDITAYFSSQPDCTFFEEHSFLAPTFYSHVLEETTCEPSESGQETFYAQSQQGCDSNVLVITTLLPSYHTLIHQTTCHASESGTSVEQFVAAAGCDSVITTVIEYVPVSQTTIQSTTCDPAEAGSESFTFESHVGCDSTITYVTTLLESPVLYIDRSTCDDAMSGLETLHFNAWNGCDSTVHIRTSFVPSYELEIHETTCQADESGIETMVYLTQQGCDSMVTIFTEFIEQEASFEWTQEEQQLQLFNTSVNTDHFFWIFGDGSFETGFEASHTYRSPGMYYVILMAVNEACSNFDVYGEWIYIEGEEQEIVEEEAPASDPLLQASLDVYPNPTFGPLNVVTNGWESSAATMSLFDINGRIVMSEALSDINATHSLDLSGIGPGIYTMQVADQHQTVNSRIFLTN